MPETPVNYRSLGRQALRYDSFIAGSATRVRLLLGPDHLLLVEKQWFRESYRRFYYKDIQAFVMVKTRRWLYFNIAFVFLLLLFALAGFGSDGGAAWFFFFMAGMFALMLGINWALSPSCRCYLKTAVQHEELAPINRESKARKALALLRREIEVVQGTAPPIAETPAAPEPTTPPAEPPPESPAEPPPAA